MRTGIVCHAGDCIGGQRISGFLAKNQLDTFAVELCREAEMSGRVGTETTRREQVLRERTGLNPKVEWSKRVISN